MQRSPLTSLIMAITIIVVLATACTSTANLPERAIGAAAEPAVRPDPSVVTVEAILDATLAEAVIEFSADQHVSGWTSLQGTGTIHPVDDEAYVTTNFADLGEPTVDLLALEFRDGRSTITHMGDPGEVTFGDGGLSEVLFTIDSMAEGATIRAFFEDVLTQVDVVIDADDALDDSAFTRLVDVDPDDDVRVEILIDGSLRLRRIELRRPTLSGDDSFDQHAVFSYQSDAALLSGGTAAGLALQRSSDVTRIVAEDTSLCAGLDATYAARLDLRHAYAVGSRDDVQRAYEIFLNAYANTFNVPEIQQTFRDVGVDSGFDSLADLERVVMGHRFGGIPAHEFDLSPVESAADRFGEWASGACPSIPSAELDLPDITPLLTVPTAESIEAGRAAFCPALLAVYDAREAFRATGSRDGAAWTPEARAAWLAFVESVDHALDVHAAATFVTDDPRLVFSWRSLSLIDVESQVRQALFEPVVPADEIFFRNRSEHLDMIDAFAESECGASVPTWEVDVDLYNRNDKSNHYRGNSDQDSFCAKALHELTLRRSLRAQLAALEAGDEDALVNAHALARRMIATARGSRNDFALVADAEYLRSWWLVSTVEWTLIASLPVPESVPSGDSDGGTPFEPSHDPAPESYDGQRQAIVDMIAERDEALATGDRLCGFPAELFSVGDDLALLDYLWSL